MVNLECIVSELLALVSRMLFLRSFSIFSVHKMFHLHRSLRSISSGRCKTCGETIQANKSSLTGMKHHIRTHRLNHRRKFQARDPEVRTEILTDLLAAGMPFAWCDYPSLQKLFDRASLGSLSRSSATRIFDSAAAELEGTLTRNLADLKTLSLKNVVFSLTLDEWTFQRKKFLGVTLHSSETIPCVKSKSVELLLIRLRDGSTAEDILQVLVDGLQRFGLSLRDIRGLTTDGARVMIRLGDLLEDAISPLPFYRQTCFAHALHLAVLDSLSAKPFDETLYRVDADERDEDGESEAVIDEPIQLDEAQVDDARDFTGTYGQTVNRVRAACSYFVKSSVRHELLLAARRRSGKKELKVLLSCNTRWNSILSMLERFMELRPQMQNVYTHQKNAFPPRVADYEAVNEMIRNLAIVEKAVDMISVEGATIMEAEHVLQVWY